jgi:uncharacterized protein (TIGR00369 family)
LTPARAGRIPAPMPAAPALTPDEFQALATEGVPFIGMLGCRVERFEPGAVTVRLPWAPALVRPGGTISGPAMMALADIALYGVVLSRIGRVELAVTTDLTVHFLRRPRPGDLLGRGRLLRLGRTLAVAEVEIAPDGEGEEPVAHAVGTYAIPSGAV